MNKLHKNHKSIILFVLLIIASLFSVLILSSCFLNKTIQFDTYPNQVAENATIESSMQEPSEALTQNAISQFLDIEDKMYPNATANSFSAMNSSSYLKNWCTENGYLISTVYSDELLYFDIAPSVGYENTPSTILYTKSFYRYGRTKTLPFDFYDDSNKNGSIVYDDNDGIVYTNGKYYMESRKAMALSYALAIAKTPNISHGPIRVVHTDDSSNLFSYVDTIGITKGYSNIIDLAGTNQVGKIGISGPDTNSNFGTFQYKETTIPADYTTFELRATMDAIRYDNCWKNNNTNAITITKDILNTLIEENVNFSIVSILAERENDDHISPNLLSFSIACEAKGKDIVQKIMNNLVENTSPNINLQYSINNSNATSCMTEEDKENVINGLKAIKNGATKINNSDYPITTNDINSFGVMQQRGSIILKQYYNGLYSDAYSNDNPRYESQYLIDNKINFGFKTSSSSPYDYLSWNQENNNLLANLIQNSYKETAGVTTSPIHLNEGSGIASVLYNNPAMYAVSLGFDVENESTLNEKLYTKSLPLQSSVLINALSKIKDIDPAPLNEKSAEIQKWKNTYLNYLNSNKINTTASFVFADVDGTGAPELFEIGHTTAEGSRCFAINNNDVSAQKTRGVSFEYLDGKSYVYCQQMHMGTNSDHVYQLTDGNWSTIFNGSFNEKTENNTVTGYVYKIDDVEVSEQEYKTRLSLFIGDEQRWQYAGMNASSTKLKYNGKNMFQGKNIRNYNDLITFLSS